jgi:hypothetical protein
VAIVVEDDPVVNADDRPVADGVVVGLDARVPLGVVADVDQRLGRARGDDDLLEQGARAGALLVDRDRAISGPVRVADRVGAALGDSGEERLRRQRVIHATARAQAVSGNSTHFRKPLE